MYNSGKGFLIIIGVIGIIGIFLLFSFNCSNNQNNENFRGGGGRVGSGRGGNRWQGKGLRNNYYIPYSYSYPYYSYPYYSYPYYSYPYYDEPLRIEIPVTIDLKETITPTPSPTQI